RKGSLLLDFIMLNVTNNRSPGDFYSGNQTASINNGGGFYDQNRLFAISRQDPLSFYFGLRYQY
ncbi:MAG: hypothetical protein H6732_17170, partial [Alphaproteobacteria bacterium]|nr:hypothetical protein [Alphaproteobacteria bacterium]